MFALSQYHILLIFCLNFIVCVSIVLCFPISFYFIPFYSTFNKKWHKKKERKNYHLWDFLYARLYCVVDIILLHGRIFLSGGSWRGEVAHLHANRSLHLGRYYPFLLRFQRAFVASRRFLKIVMVLWRNRRISPGKRIWCSNGFFFMQQLWGRH